MMEVVTELENGNLKRELTSGLHFLTPMEFTHRQLNNKIITDIILLIVKLFGTKYNRVERFELIIIRFRHACPRFEEQICFYLYKVTEPT